MSATPRARFSGMPSKVIAARSPPPLSEPNLCLTSRSSPEKAAAPARTQAPTAQRGATSVAGSMSSRTADTIKAPPARATMNPSSSAGSLP